jgi:DNA-binding LacI/PurR family transcriptional regulator
MNMKEFATICEVSPATVSYALRNDSRISEPVRLRIQAKAHELNYSPTSNSSALVRYRQRSSTAIQQPTVGIIYAHPRTSRRTKLFQLHVNSFRETVEHYGYQLKEYFLNKQIDASSALLHQIKAQQTQGLILAWGQWEQRLQNFPWQEFSVISAERNQIHPALDRVSVNHFNATKVAIKQLECVGAKRIGLICHHDLPVRVKKNIVGAYIQHILKESNATEYIPPYFYKIGDSQPEFKVWFNRHKLDGLISHRHIDLDFFAQFDLKFPTDAQYAVIEMDDDTGSDQESGIIMGDDLGQVLGEVITGKLHYGERVDLTREGNLILINGQWREGRTTHTAPSLIAHPIELNN